MEVVPNRAKAHNTVTTHRQHGRQDTHLHSTQSQVERVRVIATSTVATRTRSPCRQIGPSILRGKSARAIRYPLGCTTGIEFRSGSVGERQGIGESDSVP